MKSGWKIQPLQSLCESFKQDIVDGPFGSELQRKDYVSEGIPVLKIQNIKSHAIELKKMDYVSPAKYQTLKRHSFRDGDIVMTKLGDPLGVSAIVEGIGEGLIVADLVRIRAKGINTKYLCYHLNSSITNDFINSMQKGTTRPRVTLSVVRELPIVIPSATEQQRIVTILDQAFEGIATATANAEKNLANARELFESHLYSVFTRTGEGWKAKKLGDVCSFENGDRGVNYPSKSVQTTSGVPFINAGHLTDNGIDIASMNYIPKDRYDLLGAGKIREGDILFCLRGSLGKCASVGKLTEGAIASSLVIVRPGDSMINGFVLAYLRSHLCIEMIEKYRGGAAQPNLSAQSLKQFIIAVPAIDIQKSIMTKLDELSAETKRLEVIYKQKLVALDELKKSILHQAFTGQLN